MTTERRPILIVVPVYGARAELARCARALIATVDTTIDGVLFVNDGGQDADAVDADLRAVVDGRRGFSAVRNPRNLGFVGTCNRAALELAPAGSDILLLNSDAVPTDGWLDELAAVLAASPEHGIVCPRSDNATIASLPFRQRDPRLPRSPERTATVFAALHSRLPRFSPVPVAMGFCFLVRRELIDAYGLFDEAFAPGYGEENDFCLRMRALGFASVMANRALVYHHAGQSFPPPQRVKLRARHEQLLQRRHPEYRPLVHRYLHDEADAVDVFADAIVPSGDEPRILLAFPAGTTPALPAHGGTARLSILGDSAGSQGEHIPDVLGHRIWDVAIAVGDVGERRLCIAGSSAPRFLAVPDVTIGVLREATELAAQQVDDAGLRSRWLELSRIRRRSGLLDPPALGPRARLFGLLERHLPRVATRLRQLAS